MASSRRESTGNSRLKFTATVLLCLLIVVQIPHLYRAATNTMVRSGAQQGKSITQGGSPAGDCGEDRFNCAHDDAAPIKKQVVVAALKDDHNDPGVEPEDSSSVWTTVAPPTTSPAVTAAVGGGEKDITAGDEEQDNEDSARGSRRLGEVPLLNRTLGFGNPFPPMKQTVRPCLAGSYKQGQWIFNPEKRPLYDSYGEILGCCQQGADKKRAAEIRTGGATTVPKYRPETQYEWQPETCDLVPWSEQLFCESLRGRDLMLAGDSLNDHWHASLFYLLGGKKDIYRKEGTGRGKHRCHGHPICGRYYPKPLKLFFLTNQLLAETSRAGRNYKWHKTINEYPILILNSGSWMRDPANEDREVSDVEWERLQRNALRLVKEVKQYNGTVIWRTSYQGHPYCWKYTEPLTEELKDEDFPNVAPYKRYRWFAIPKRNDYAVKLWKKEGAEILDVKRITNLMPLGHLGQNHPKFGAKNTTDCLHYCSPGPSYDTWSMLLMNLLLGNIGE